MKKLTSIKDLDVIIRNALIFHSQIDGAFVRNALSEYGADLDKSDGDSIFESLLPSDTCILFEIQSADSDYDASMTEGNDLTYFKSFGARIIIYGDNSGDVGVTLSARLRSEYSRSELYEQGIYISDISNPIHVDEYKNGAIWHRCDFDIEFSVQLTIPQVAEDENFEILNETIIKEA